MRIGVYIGSFNPPHLGHKKVIEFLIKNNYVDKLFIIPTQNYWNKKNIIAKKHRINMLKYYENDKVKIKSIPNKYEYSYQILLKIQNDHPKDTIHLIIGSDNLEKLHEWKNQNELKKYPIIVLKRGEIKKNNKLNGYKITYIDDFKNINISSTEIRNGKNKYLDLNIKKYIEENNLYKE